MVCRVAQWFTVGFSVGQDWNYRCWIVWREKGSSLHSSRKGNVKWENWKIGIFD